MQIAGLIPFKFSTDQAMASLYFLRIFINFFSFSYVKSVAIIIDCALSAPKKAYFRCLGNSFITHFYFLYLLFTAAWFFYTVFI